MVKNYGGNKSKKQGRKFVNKDSTTQNTRLSKQEDEIYAAVIKEYGNGMACIKCVDGEERLLVIRKKFKGRSKRDNLIKSGTWVLAGLRSWEVLKADAKEKCDLLEVYDSDDIEFLKQSVDINWNSIKNIGRIETINESDDIHFTTNEYVDDLNISDNDEDEDSEDINIDDL